MIAKTFVLACAVFGLVAGSCFEIQVPQQCASQQVVNIPVSSESSSCSVPSFSDNVFSSTGCSDLFSSGSSSGQVIAVPVSSSDNSFSEIFSSLGSSSSGLQATNGPESSALQVIEAPSVSLPAQEGPAVVLSSPAIPAPRVLSQRCVCTKTIVKPQVYQRTVVVPKIQRYIKRTVTPVVENVAYKSSPVQQQDSSSASVVLSSGSGCGSQSISFGSSESPAKYISLPVSSSSSSCPRFC